MDWYLAIDFGTTSSAAARRVGDRVEIVQFHGSPRISSAVFWQEGSGEGRAGRLVIGEEAEELASLAPWLLERTPKRRIGEEFIQLGEEQIRPVEIVAEIYHEIYDEAVAISGGEAPAEIRLTHPARWRDTRLKRLEQAAELAGIARPTFVPEPVAAAMHFGAERLEDGDYVAVYDLGGGTLDTAVVQRQGEGFEVIGRPGGNEEFGGEDFDDLVYRFLGEQLPGEAWERLRRADELEDRQWGQANRELRRQARRAKERLSRNPDVRFYIPNPVDHEFSLAVDELEGLIAREVRTSVSELDGTIARARLETSEFKAVYLAGGSSRIPLVGRMIEQELGVRPEHLDDPKAVIAMGAARMSTKLDRTALDHQEPGTESPASASVSAMTTQPVVPEGPAEPAATEREDGPAFRAPVVSGGGPEAAAGVLGPPDEGRHPPESEAVGKPLLKWVALGAVVLVAGIAALFGAGAFSGGGDSGSGSGSAEADGGSAEAGSGQAEKNGESTGSTSPASPSGGKEVTEVDLSPIDGSGVTGTATFRIVDESNLAVDLDLTGLSPASHDEVLLLWLMVGRSAGFPVGKIEPDPDGDFFDTLPVPQAIAATVGSRATDVTVSASPTDEITKEVQKAAKQDDPVIAFVGPGLASGKIPLAPDGG